MVKIRTRDSKGDNPIEVAGLNHILAKLSALSLSVALKLC